MKRSKNRVIRSLLTPQCVGSLAFGLGLGMLSMMPFGLRVSDAVAGLMGAIVGAVAGIAGALGVVSYTYFNQGRNVADYLVHALIPVTRGNRSIVNFYEGLDRNDHHKGNWSSLNVEAVLQLSRIERAKRLLKRIEPVVTALKASSIRAYARIEESLDELESCVEDAVRESEAGGGAYRGIVYMDIGADLKRRDFGLNLAANRLSDDYGLPPLSEVGAGTVRDRKPKIMR